jgi:hypothetical protein
MIFDLSSIGAAGVADETTGDASSLMILALL